jgi:hypothetical protein
MKPSLVLSRDVNVRHGSDRAYLAGEHGFDLSSHLTGRRGLLTRPSFFLCPRPSLASRQLGCHPRWLRSPGSATACAPSPHLCWRCAVVRRELQFLLADDNIELPSTLDRQSTRATLVPINCLALARVRRQASGLMSMPKTHPAPPSCSFASWGES